MKLFFTKSISASTFIIQSKHKKPRILYSLDLPILFEVTILCN